VTERTLARWEHFAHGADIGVRGVASTLVGAFEQAAQALTAIVTEPDDLEAREPVEVTADAPDNELLLVDWLNLVSMRWLRGACCSGVSRS
jgi:SHS2 domain-containing protein